MYLWDRQRHVFGHLPGVHQSVKLILQLLKLLFPLAHLLSLQLVPLGSLCCRHRNRVQHRPLLPVTAAVWLALLVRPELSAGQVGSGCAVCSVGGGGGGGGVVAVAPTGQTGDGCTTVAGSAAVFQAEGLKANLIILCQDRPHLQAVVEGACHMEGHDAGGHWALDGEETERLH